jgi:hypothetical protein
MRPEVFKPTCPLTVRGGTVRVPAEPTPNRRVFGLVRSGLSTSRNRTGKTRTKPIGPVLKPEYFQLRKNRLPEPTTPYQKDYQNFSPSKQKSLKPHDTDQNFLAY